MGANLSATTSRAGDLDDQFVALNRNTDVAAANALIGKSAVRWWDVLFGPAAVFLKLYFLKGGLREGAPGFISAGLGAFSEFAKYAKMWEQLRER